MYNWFIALRNLNKTNKEHTQRGELDFHFVSYLAKSPWLYFRTALLYCLISMLNLLHRHQL